jgi:transposase
METLSQEAHYQLMKGWLNERQWRLYVATEARRIGPGGISQVAREAGVTRKTIRKGLAELVAGALYQPGERIRQQGGGRKKNTVKDATLRADLEGMLDPKGDPESLLRWTSKSVSKLRKALTRQGHTIGETAIRGMLHEMGFSLKATKKSIEGGSHADRDAQFQHINRTGKAFEAKGQPIISVDCKKKELIGNFKNGGREWQAKGQETTVNVYDYLSIADGKAIPYGIYDLVQNSGFVNVGIDHETAEFAVESIRRWWKSVGSNLYPRSRELLIVADGGGSNGARSRLWKQQVQLLATETGLAITVCLRPPANGIRSSIDSFPTFPSIGVGSLSPLLRPLLS